MGGHVNGEIVKEGHFVSRVLKVVLWGRSAARVQRVQKVQKVQRVVVSPYRAMSFIMPPSAVTSISSVIIILTLVHPFATSWPSSPKGDARTLRIHLSVSYSMISILRIGSLRSPPLSGFAGLPPMQGAE